MEDVLKKVLVRINELKYEKVHLRPFITSDSAKIDEIDATIIELEWVCDLLRQKLNAAE